MLFFRWLVFFVLGDALCAILVPAVVFPLVHIWYFLDAVWDAVFVPIYDSFGIARATRMIYSARTENVLGFLDAVIMSVFLPGLIGGFLMARESFIYTGWRFWKWR